MAKYTIKNPHGGDPLVFNTREPISEEQIKKIYHQEFFSPEATEALAKSKMPEAGQIPDSARATGLGLLAPQTLGTAIPAGLPGIITHLVDKYLKGNPEASERVQAAAEGGLGGATLGLSDVARTRAFGAPLDSKEDPQKRYPWTALSGRIAGGLTTPVPFAGWLKTGGTLTKIGKGGVIGGGLGGTAGAISAFEDPNLTFQESVGEIPRKAGTGAAIGGVAGGVLTGLGIGGVKLWNKFKPREVNELVATVLNIPDSDAGGQANVVNGLYTKVMPEIKSNIPKTVKAVEEGLGIMEGASKSLNNRLDVFKPYIETTPADIFANNINTLDAVKSVTERLQTKVSDPKKLQAAIRQVESILSDMDKSNVLKKAKALNKEVSSYYSAPDAARSHLFEAKKALRDYVGGGIRNILEVQRVDPNVYSEYGLIDDFMVKIGEKVLNAKNESLVIRGEDMSESFVKGSTGSVGVKGSIVGGTARAMKDSPINKLNSKLALILKKTPTAKASPFEGLALTPEDIASRQQALSEQFQLNQELQNAIQAQSLRNQSAGDMLANVVKPPRSAEPIDINPGLSERIAGQLTMGRESKNVLEQGIAERMSKAELLNRLASRNRAGTLRTLEAAKAEDAALRESLFAPPERGTLKDIQDFFAEQSRIQALERAAKYQQKQDIAGKVGAEKGAIKEQQKVDRQTQKTMTKKETGEILEDFYYKARKGFYSVDEVKEVLRRRADPVFLQKWVKEVAGRKSMKDLSQEEWQAIDDVLFEAGIKNPVK